MKWNKPEIKPNDKETVLIKFIVKENSKKHLKYAIALYDKGKNRYSVIEDNNMVEITQRILGWCRTL